MNRLKHTTLIFFLLELEYKLGSVNCSNGQSGTVWQERILM